MMIVVAVVLLVLGWVGAYYFVGWLIAVVGVEQLVRITLALSLGGAVAAAVVRFLIRLDKALMDRRSP